MRHERPSDYDAFDRRALAVFVHADDKTYRQASVEIEALRQDIAAIKDAAVRRHVRRTLNRCLLMMAIDKSQPRATVDALYARSVRQGFNDPHGKVASAIEYADYCREHRDSAKGLRALRSAKKSLYANKKAGSRGLKNFIREIDIAISHLQKS